MAPLRLWIPETPQLSEELRAALAMPLMDPRGPEMKTLEAELDRRLRELLGFSGALRLLPGALHDQRRRLTPRAIPGRALYLVTGPDSARARQEVDGSAEHEALTITIPPGRAIMAEGIPAVLTKAGELGGLVLQLVERGTGTAHPIRDIAPPVFQHGGVSLVLDITGAALSQELELDRERVDLLFADATGFDLPAGMVLVGARGEMAERLGWDSDEGLFGAAPESLPQPLLFGLATALKLVEVEGRAARQTRHWHLAARARAFARERLELISDEGYCAYSLTCVGTPEGLDLEDFHRRMRARGHVLGRGLGELAGRSFRIAHTGTTTVEELDALLDEITAVLDAMEVPWAEPVRDSDKYGSATPEDV